MTRLSDVQKASINAEIDGIERFERFTQILFSEKAGFPLHTNATVCQIRLYMSVAVRELGCWRWGVDVALWELPSVSRNVRVVVWESQSWYRAVEVFSIYGI